MRFWTRWRSADMASTQTRWQQSCIPGSSLAQRCAGCSGLNTCSMRSEKRCAIYRDSLSRTSSLCSKKPWSFTNEMSSKNERKERNETNQSRNKHGDKHGNKHSDKHSDLTIHRTFTILGPLFQTTVQTRLHTPAQTTPRTSEPRARDLHPFRWSSDQPMAITRSTWSHW